MEKKNTMLLTVIAVATLLVAVVGATFAYFNVTGDGSSTTTITATTQAVGAVSLATKDALHINLTGAEMSQATAGTTGVTYYFTSDDKKDKAESAADGTATLATASINGGAAGVNYLCTATVSVAATSDLGATGIAALTLIENSTAGQKITYYGSSDGKKVVDLYSGATTDASSTFTVTFKLTSTENVTKDPAVADVFNITGYATYNNLTTEQAQADISTSLEIESFTCNTVGTFS